MEENPLEIHQAFLDFVPIDSEFEKLTFRIGRQELAYGTQRLVGTREGPNNRQSFDALRSIYEMKKTRIEMFYSQYVNARKMMFDDKFMDKNKKLWGFYLTQNQIPYLNNMDLYYIGFEKLNAKYNNVYGREIRHSFGVRFFNSKNNWKYDTEALYQTGKLGNQNISAWSASVNTSYKFSSLIFKPELCIKTNFISGDLNKANSTSEAFNPLFPRGANLGIAGLIGPSNLIDVQPTVSLSLTPKLVLDIEYYLFWRYSTYDGIYAVNMAKIYPSGNSSEKHIGKQLVGTLSFTPNKFLYFRGELTWFKAGQYLKEVGAGKDILMTGITAQFKF